MMSSSDIKKMVKKITRQQQGLRDKQIMHPVREWYVGLLVAIIILAVTILWSASTYLDNKNIEIISNETETTEPVMYRESLVEEVLEEFRRREQVRDSLLPEQVVGIPEAEIASTTQEVASSTSEVIEEVNASSTDAELIE